MRWMVSFVIAGVTCSGAGCGHGVSENPLAGEAAGGTSALDAGGSSGSTAATSGTGTSGGTGSGAGGRSTGGNSGTQGTSTGGTDSGVGGSSRGGGSGTGGSSEPEGKRDGSRCSDHDECDSGNCNDGVCCNEACDGVCERCDAVPGTCTLDEADDACPAPYECTGRSRCRLPDGETCADGIDCESGHCTPGDGGATICCTTVCGDDACETCGSDGKCNDHPAEDDRCGPATCEPDTRCVTYRSPAPNACSGHGQCAGCDSIPTHAGVPCGVGSQCDGEGACEVTGRGSVAAGERHTCAVNGDANVVCWGDNRFGQLGAVWARQRVGLDEMPSDVPERTIDFQRDVVQIAAGAQHTCVLFDDGGVRCWGTMWDHPTFGRVTTILGTVQVAFVLGSQSLAPPFGFIDPLATGDVILAEPAEQISAAPEGATICALLRSGKISCWGLNLFGQLGLGHRNPLSISHLEVLPVVDLGERAVEVRSGFAHTCALTESGRIQCWGDGLYGRLGSGESGPRYSPSDPVEIGESAVGLAIGFDHTCALVAGGAVRCWGNNHQGQLGYGHTLPIGDDETPAEAAALEGPEGRPILGGNVALGTGIAQVMTFPASSVRGTDGIWNSSPTCALSDDGFVRCWGRNDVGQLGYGHAQTGATEHTPVELGELRISDRFVDTGGEVLALAEGGRCALRRDNGSLYCWGANDQGQVGVPENPAPSLTSRPIDIGPVHWWVP